MPVEARQTSAAERKTSAGQSPLVPVQLSGGSQMPVEARQTSAAERKTSAGQSPLVPVQLSGGSQTPVEARQTSAAERKTSAGQAPLVPVQFSGGSQMPVEARQTSAAERKTSAGQAPLVPVQFSGGSQMPVEARQTSAAERKTSAGQAPLVPVQVSGGSQMPVEARQTSAAERKTSAGQSALVPVQVSGGSQMPVEARHTVELELKVVSHTPVVWLQMMDASHVPGVAQAGQRFRNPDWVFPDAPPSEHTASVAARLSNPTTSSNRLGVASFWSGVAATEACHETTHPAPTGVFSARWRGVGVLLMRLFTKVNLIWVVTLPPAGRVEMTSSWLPLASTHPALGRSSFAPRSRGLTVVPSPA